MNRVFGVSILIFLISILTATADDVSDAPGGSILYSSIGPRGWDVFVLEAGTNEPRQLTTHPALDYNAVLSPDGQRVAFVSERDGTPELYTIHRDGTQLQRITDSFSLDDHPTWSPDGKRIAFSSTRQATEKVGQAWNAIYVINDDGSGLRRLSPNGVTDYSPAWSPDGEWLACASGSGDAGGTKIYVMKPDGSDRKVVVNDGGWPSFSSDSQSIYFHRKDSDTSRWSVWRVKTDGTQEEQVVAIESDVVTPRVSNDGKHFVASTVRDGKRHIVTVDLAAGEQTQVTDRRADHWNPSICSDGHIVYHATAPDFTVPNIEIWGTPPGHKFQMLRLGGAFPAVSPDGKQVALTGGNFGRFDVMNIDGSDRRTLFESKPRHIFSLTWSSGKTGAQRIAFSHGKSFQGAESIVNVETVAPDGSGHKSLTRDEGNNAFPSFSPDGSQMVFRSGRDGNKNLYVMNTDGSDVRRLTKGKWADTMADWSPTGEWIAFSSDRDKNFEIYVVRPDGTDLRKLVGGNVRHNHPHFAPDGKWIVFTCQRAGLSAESISLPRQPQPYGDLFAVRLDGTGLTRLTHNAFEEGTPEWSSATVESASTDGKPSGQHEF